ncbi:bile acid:sodium symporter [Aureococcus anophagefferens]|uniref:Bile acid:sodium symporter n=1 Tax=Aureococcus anophagefferens TaxID=44056 RepID=A0ABR1FN56_AURAN
MRVSLFEFCSQLLLFVLLASMAGSCDARLCLLQFRKAKGIICGLCCHFLVMPFLGYVCTVSGRDVGLDWYQILVSCSVVAAAVAAGLVASAHLERRGRSIVNKFGTLAGIALMGLSGARNTMSHDPIYRKPLRWFLGVCLPVPMGLGATVTISRMLKLPPPEATTVAIECVYQNTALALTIALSARSPVGRGAATAVPLVYGLAEIVFIGLFGVFAWQMGWSHAPPTENLFKSEQAQHLATDDG